MLDLKTWVSGSIFSGGNILLLFYCSKASDAKIGIIAKTLCDCENRY